MAILDDPARPALRPYVPGQGIRTYMENPPKDVRAEYEKGGFAGGLGAAARNLSALPLVTLGDVGATLGEASRMQSGALRAITAPAREFAGKFVAGATDTTVPTYPAVTPAAQPKKETPPLPGVPAKPYSPAADALSASTIRGNLTTPGAAVHVAPLIPAPSAALQDAMALGFGLQSAYADDRMAAAKALIDKMSAGVTHSPGVADPYQMAFARQLGGFTGTNAFGALPVKAMTEEQGLAQRQREAELQAAVSRERTRAQTEAQRSAIRHQIFNVPQGQAIDKETMTPYTLPALPTMFDASGRLVSAWGTGVVPTGQAKQTYTEGTEIVNDKGDVMVRKNGAWVPKT